MCLNPIEFTDKDGRFWRSPCGKCFECKNKKSNEWATRIMLEASNYKTVPLLITLTYNDDNVKYCEDMLTRDITLFIKRLRKKFGFLRYFYCMEYGNKHGRPHFHCIFFGLELCDLLYLKTTKKGEKIYISKTIKELWYNDYNETMGFHSVGICDTVNAAKYCTLYLNSEKKGKGFRHMSLKPPIGCINLQTHVDWLRTGKFVYQGKSKPLLRCMLNVFEKLGYYRRVIELKIQRFNNYLRCLKEFNIDDFNKRREKVIKCCKCNNIILDRFFRLC